MANVVSERGEAIIKRLPNGAKVAEVGVLIGKLSEYILRKRKDVTLFMIDSWAPAEEQPDTYKETGDVHSTHDKVRVSKHKAEAMNRARHFPDRARIMHMTSLEASRQVEDYSLDLVFLDADHSYAGVMADLTAWVRKVKAPDGWIGGHDFANPEPGYDFSGVQRAVLEWSHGRDIELDGNYTWFCRPWKRLGF